MRAALKYRRLPYSILLVSWASLPQVGLASLYIQEAQLMLTNLRDVFKGQSRSSNMVPFNTLGMDSYLRAIVTLSVRVAHCAFDKKCRDLANEGQDHWKC